MTRPTPGRDHLRLSIARLLAARRCHSCNHPRGSGDAGNPGPPPPSAHPLDLKPCNAFEVAIAEQLKALRRELDQLATRVNWLLTLIVGAAVTNIVIALLK
jgi:hypothetical protein